jgi:hypothetical protein
LRQLTGFHRLHVFAARSVTRLTGYSHGGFARVQASPDVRSKTVAGEASEKFGGIYRTRRGFREIVW